MARASGNGCYGRRMLHHVVTFDLKQGSEAARSFSESLKLFALTASLGSTESLVMRSRSGTVRTVQARHDRPKLREITGGRYG